MSIPQVCSAPALMDVNVWLPATATGASLDDWEALPSPTCP